MGAATAIPHAPECPRWWAVTLQHHAGLAHTVRLHCIDDSDNSFVIPRSEHATSAHANPFPIS